MRAREDASLSPRKAGGATTSPDSAPPAAGTGAKLSNTMSDVMTRAQRSYCMSRIRATNTTPERIVRAILVARRCRFRQHDRRLPGAPDFILDSIHGVVFVHGCF